MGHAQTGTIEVKRAEHLFGTQLNCRLFGHHRCPYGRQATGILHGPPLHGATLGVLALQVPSSNLSWSTAF
jgi:hypothetical protein